jgi:hypothetical protein
MTLKHNLIPRGCYKEIRSYQHCVARSSKDECFGEKISIMEVCPDHVLEALREKKKWYLRAEMIDNDTYKRAMQVSDFNKDRSVSDLKLKTWDSGKTRNLRTDSLWQDDRYNPLKYSHPHRFDNINFPEQEYTDFFGGTRGDGEMADYENNRLGMFDQTSKAMRDHQSEKRKLRFVVEEVKDLNEKKE